MLNFTHKMDNGKLVLGLASDENAVLRSQIMSLLFSEKGWWGNFTEGNFGSEITAMARRNIINDDTLASLKTEAESTLARLIPEFASGFSVSTHIQDGRIILNIIVTTLQNEKVEFNAIANS